MYRHPFLWFYLFGRPEKTLWSLARFMWTVIALFLAFLLIIGMTAKRGEGAVAPAAQNAENFFGGEHAGSLKSSPPMGPADLSAGHPTPRHRAAPHTTPLHPTHR